VTSTPNLLTAASSQTPTGYLLIMMSSVLLIVMTNCHDQIFTVQLLDDINLLKLDWFCFVLELFVRGLAIAILSVCPSRGWISQKRCKLGLPSLYHRLPRRL